jgi:hypothetical protein
MSITQRFLSEDNEPQSIDVASSQPGTKPISRSAPKLAGDPSLSPRKDARDEREKSIKHTMPDDPQEDYA